MIRKNQYINKSQKYEIINDYADRIAQALKQYDNNAYTIEYYEVLAWQGLGYTYGWQQKTQEEKDAINAKVNEINSGNKNCN